MNKKWLLLLFIPLLFCASCRGGGDDDDDDDDEITTNSRTLGNDGPNSGKEFGWDAGNIGGKTGTITGNISAAQYFYAKGLDAGWNLGNALDGSVTNETSWGNPTIVPAAFSGIKEQGFNVVRIPITWSSALDVAPDYTITATALNRVAAVVDMAYNAGLVAIINTHHDGGASWLTTAAMSQANRETAANRYDAIWTQIANKFKDYGEWLIFEPFNEIRNGNNWDNSPNPNVEYPIINEWNQVFTDAVRKTGGNNEQRFLIAKAYAAKPNRTADTATFKLPTDTASDKLIVSFHYYEPYGFTLEGGTINWNATSGKKMMTSDFNKFKKPYIDVGIPVLIGECGASYQGDLSADDKATAHANRLAYMECLGSTAQEYDLVPVLWDNGKHEAINKENSGLFNRSTGKPNSTISAEVIAAFMKGIR